MANRVPTLAPVQHGSNKSFWVEYPSGLVDLSRSHPLNDSDDSPPPLVTGQVDIAVEGKRSIRIDAKSTAIVIVDMQNFFLHPALRSHPGGLQCVDRLIEILPTLRSKGIKIIWLNWGLTEHELETIPPSLVRGFRKLDSKGGFGAPLPNDFGRLLMRDARNSELYGPLQGEYLRGKSAGTDVWIHKNRISGLSGNQSALDLFLQENGLTTLLFGGVNTDQCVLGTVADAYFKGYDCVIVKDTTATTSPDGGFSNFIYNATNIYGFVTDTKSLLATA